MTEYTIESSENTSAFIEKVNFDSLNMKISENLNKYPLELQNEIFEYLSQLDELNKKAYDIAYTHLGTSFSINRSNGFKKWQLEKKTT